jgi:hypothetical protein
MTDMIWALIKNPLLYTILVTTMTDMNWALIKNLLLYTILVTLIAQLEFYYHASQNT